MKFNTETYMRHVIENECIVRGFTATNVTRHIESKRVLLSMNLIENKVCIDGVETDRFGSFLMGGLIKHTDGSMEGLGAFDWFRDNEFYVASSGEFTINDDGRFHEVENIYRKSPSIDESIKSFTIAVGEYVTFDKVDVKVFTIVA